MKPLYNIATAADKAYFIPLYVMLYSLFKNNKSVRLFIYILNNDFDEDQKKQLAKLAEGYGHEVAWLKITDAKAAHYYTSAHISVASYFRIYLPLLLPAHVKSILYLDPDIIIRDDIETLLKTDMGNVPVMAIKEAVPYQIERLGIPAGYDYFNAGVLLMNIEEWRKHNYHTNILNNVEQKKSHYLMHDQDALNAFFYDKVVYLDPKWNHQTGYYHLSPQQLAVRYECDAQDLLQNAPLIHFVGQNKPWLYVCTHPFKPLFLQYLQQTPFASFAEKPSLSLMLNKTGKRIQHKLKKILHR